MSIFTSFVSQVLEVPGANGHTITIRKLAPKALERARAVSREQGAAELRLQRESLGGDEFKALQAEIAQAVAAGTVKAADPLQLYDRGVLIAEGVTAWSFPELEPTPAAFEQIEEDVQDWLARAILRLAKPSLFQTAEEQEAARKNG